MERKKKVPVYEIKDRQVPPVKGAVTDLQDIVVNPTAMFSGVNLSEQVNSLEQLQ